MLDIVRHVVGITRKLTVVLGVGSNVVNPVLIQKVAWNGRANLNEM